MKLLLKNLLFTLVVPGTVAIWVPLVLARNAAAPEPWRYWLAAPFFTLGVVLYSWTVANFALIGRGTPAPIDAPRRLIVVGPHRYVRNPMYLGVLSAIFGWALLHSLARLFFYGLAVALTFHLFVVLVEEPSLRRQFGDEYTRYRAAVRRWIPGRGMRETA